MQEGSNISLYLSGEEFPGVAAIIPFLARFPSLCLGFLTGTPGNSPGTGPGSPAGRSESRSSPHRALLGDRDSLSSPTHGHATVATPPPRCACPKHWPRGSSSPWAHQTKRGRASEALPQTGGTCLEGVCGRELRHAASLLLRREAKSGGGIELGVGDSGTGRDVAQVEVDLIRVLRDEAGEWVIEEVEGSGTRPCSGR
jgi:hypothetical protein